MITTLINQVTPISLRTVEGWNQALAAQCPGPAATTPLWLRGDVAQPIVMADGVLFGCSDTWISGTGPANSLARCTYVHVGRSGKVRWLKPEGGAALAQPGGYGWWWPSGGVPIGRREALLFGSSWDPGIGYGQYRGPSVTTLVVPHPGQELPDPEAPVPVALDHSLRWGPPAATVRPAVERIVLAGYDPATWRHRVAVHELSGFTDEYEDGWEVYPIEIERGPLGPLALRPWRGGWLATAKILCSGPELAFPETPEIACWWARDAAGPYRRLGDLHDDTRKEGWRSYAACGVELPGVGLVAMWSRNGWTDDPTYSTDEYGPHFAPAWVPLASELRAT